VHFPGLLSLHAPRIGRVEDDALRAVDRGQAGRGRVDRRAARGQPGGLEILLAILHGTFGAVPTTVSLNFLCGILVVADKYDLIHLLQPFVNRWVGAVKTPTPEGSCKGRAPLLGFTGSHHFTRIYAAWELGCDDLVAQDMTDLVFNVSRIGDDFHYKDRVVTSGHHSGPPDLLSKHFHGWPAQDSIHPARAAACFESTRPLTSPFPAEVVSELRLALIQSLLDFYQTEVTSHMKSMHACVASTRQLDWAVCDSTILGAMWRHLLSAGLGFLPKTAAEYGGSANGLIQTLEAMFAQVVAVGGHDVYPFYEVCGIRGRG